MRKRGRFSRRQFIKGAATAAAGMAISACAKKSPASQEVTITFLTQAHTGPDEEDRYIPLFPQLKEAAPNITVDIIRQTGGAIEIQQKLLTLIAAGTGPDTYWTHTYINPGLAKRNVPLDINDMIDDDTAFDRNAFFQSSMNDFALGGKQYGLPRETTSTILIYNKSLFDANGMETPQPNWSWTDFVSAAKALTQGEGADKTYGCAGFNLNYYTFVRMWQLGGDVLNEDRTQFTMNEEPALSGVKFIQDLIHTHKVHITGAELAGRSLGEVFTSGKIGMFPQFSVFTALAGAEFEFDIQHWPRDPGDTQTTRVASAGHSIWSGTENPDPSWEWMKVIHSEEAYIHYVVTTGLTIPAMKSVAESDAHMDPTKPPKSKSIILEALAYARPEPVSGDWIGVHREITSALEGVYGVSQRTPKEALDEIAARVNELIATEPSAG
jgi:multiple sugar transport system substrate-binding protein